MNCYGGVRMEDLKQRIERNSETAGSIIEEWYEMRTNLEINIEEIGTKEKLAKFIHKEELTCRRLVEELPESESIEICMTIYAELVYGKYKKYYGKGNLHLNATETIRILQYGAGLERERKLFSPVKLHEVFNHVEVMLMARELVQMIDADVLSEPERISIVRGEFVIQGKDRLIIEQYRQHVTGKGLRYRIARSTRELLYGGMWKQSFLENKLVEGIQSILSGTVSGKDIPFFIGTFYEFLPSISECDNTYRLFLQQLLRRVDFYINLEKFMYRLFFELYPNEKDKEEALYRVLNSVTIVPNGMVKSCMIFTPQWRRGDFLQCEKIGVLSNPIVKNCWGAYITNDALCGDALNSWLEETIYEGAQSVAWKAKICQAIELAFEDEVRAYMREQNVVAGKLEQNGNWYKNNNVGVEKLDITLPGEVDVFALNACRKIAYLIECKSLQDVLTTSGNPYKKLRNVRKKLTGTFIQTLKQKRACVKTYMDKHLPEYELITVIVTDIDFPAYSLDEEESMWEQLIIICDFEEFKTAVKMGRNPKSIIAHVK